MFTDLNNLFMIEEKERTSIFSNLISDKHLKLNKIERLRAKYESQTPM